MGNPWRRDDAAGLVAARRLRETLPPSVQVLEREGEPTSLIDAWQGADALWLLDAVSSGAPAGTLHRLDASDHGLPADVAFASTHHVGLSEAIELARALGRLPTRVVVYGIVGASFEVGDGITPAVEAAVKRVADSVLGEVHGWDGRR